MASNDAQYEVVWPKAPAGGQQRPLADRLDSLAGKRIGFVWDYLFRGEEIFPVIGRELTRRYPDLTVVGYDQFGNIHGADEAKLVASLGAELHARHVDAVICGNGC